MWDLQKCSCFLHFECNWSKAVSSFQDSHHSQCADSWLLPEDSAAGEVLSADVGRYGQKRAARGMHGAMNTNLKLLKEEEEFCVIVAMATWHTLDTRFRNIQILIVRSWLLLFSFEGLEVIESTNLKYFSKEKSAEFYALKGMFLAQIGRCVLSTWCMMLLLGVFGGRAPGTALMPCTCVFLFTVIQLYPFLHCRSEDANKAFSAAVQMFDTLVKAWALWGDYLEALFTRER